MEPLESQVSFLLEADRLKTVLKSEGYYAGTVTYAVQGDKKPAVVVLTVPPGTLYKLKRYDVRLTRPGGNDPAVPRACAMARAEPAPVDLPPRHAALDGLSRELSRGPAPEEGGRAG